MTHLPTARRRAPRRLAAAAALAATLFGALPAVAQDALPVVRLSQMPGTGNAGFGGAASVRLDRDAFLVVLEIGADHRARIVYPASPKDRGFARADRIVRVPLPSADAAFIRTAELRVPEIVAFASDMAPDLAAFTENGKWWDYQFSVMPGAGLEETVRGIAELIYGSADMPYSVATRRVFAQVPTFAYSALQSCGYNMNSPYSDRFNQFLWQSFGPVSVLETNWMIEQRYRNFQWEGPFWFMAAMLPNSYFSRSINMGLWNTFGAVCDPLRGQFRYLDMVNLAYNPGVPVTPPGEEGPEDGPEVPPPADRDGEVKPPVVPGVEIVPASPRDMQRRAESVTRVATARNEAMRGGQQALEARGPLTRESNYDMVKRQEIATVMAYLSAQRARGQSGSVIDAFERVRAGQALATGANGSDRQGRFLRPTDYRGYTPGRGEGGVRGSAGSGSGGSVGGSSSSGGGAVGSGSMSGGSEGRGGGEGRGGAGGRGGSGRPF